MGKKFGQRLHKVKIPCEHEGRDQCKVSANQEVPKIVSTPPGA
jgi:hypothetical protein